MVRAIDPTNALAPAVRPPAHGGNLAWAATVAACALDDILDFSASINPLGPPATAIAAIQANLLPLLRAYPDPSYADLRTALGRFHNLDPDWILPGNGAAELLSWSARELAALSATYLPTPAFGDYRRSLAAFKARIVPLPLSLDGSFQLPEFPGDIRDCGLILNNPHNPTGGLFYRDTILSALDRFSLVVLDEAFMDFLPGDESVLDAVKTFPNLVVLRSLTKFYSLPGLRVGYAVSEPERLRRWQQWRDPWPVNALAAVASIAALADRDFQERTRRWLAPARQELLAGLAAIPGLTPRPGAANFLLVRSDRAVPELQSQLLQQHRILVRDCLSFPELGDRYFRVAVRTPEENRSLLQGLVGIA